LLELLNSKTFVRFGIEEDFELLGRHVEIYDHDVNLGLGETTDGALKGVIEDLSKVERGIEADWLPTMLLDKADCGIKCVNKDSFRSEDAGILVAHEWRAVFDKC